MLKEVDVVEGLSVFDRASIVSRGNPELGVQYEGRRRLYDALSYPQVVTFEDMYDRYLRQDIAHAIVSRPVSATWAGDLDIFETQEEDDTELEKAWHELSNSLLIKTELSRVDTLACLGKFALLFLGFDDVSSPQGYATPVSKSKKRKLLYVRPFGYNVVRIKLLETDMTSPRYGMPTLYEVSPSLSAEVQGEQLVSENPILVHWTRVIHVCLNNIASNYLGTPILEAPYNRLVDLEKLVGGSAEMFWRGARPGYQGVVKDEFILGEDAKEKIQRQLDEYESDLRRFLVINGVEMSALETQVADPQTHIQAQIQMISAVTSIPSRILSGSERGELASTQDRDSWFDFIGARRSEYAEPKIMRPLIDRLIEFGALPPPKSESDGYRIQWPALYRIPEKEKAEMGRTRATATQQYATSPFATSIIPLKAFYKYILGLSDDDIEYIEKVSRTELEDEILDLQLAAMNPEEPNPEGSSPQAGKAEGRKQKGSVEAGRPQSKDSSGRVRSEKAPNLGGV